MRTVALVPRRADGGRRDELWAYVRSRWEAEHPECEIFEGHHDGPGKFSRSQAINEAAAEAGDFDVAVINDADSFVGPDQIDDGVALAAKRGFVLPYTHWRSSGRDMSDRIMGGFNGNWYVGVELTLIEWTCSNVVIVNRSVWDQVGGFDERFVSWGMEDVAFSLACQTFAGSLNRTAGDVWHLWHPPSPEINDGSPEFVANVALLERYRVAAYDRDAMGELLAQRHQEAAA